MFLLLTALDKNEQIGLSDLAVYLIFGTFSESLEIILTIIPSFILMSKVIPPGIEGTMFSLTVTLIALSNFVIRNLLGTVINDLFVKVTKENLDNFWILMTIQLVSKFYPLLIINCLVPTNKEVNDLQYQYLKEANILISQRESVKLSEQDPNEDELV